MQGKQRREMMGARLSCADKKKKGCGPDEEGLDGSFRVRNFLQRMKKFARVFCTNGCTFP
jgi:hypothetical protein